MAGRARGAQEGVEEKYKLVEVIMGKKGPKSRFTKEIIDQMQQDYEKGTKIKDIAIKYKTCNSHVLTLLNRRNRITKVKRYQHNAYSKRKARLETLITGQTLDHGKLVFLEERLNEVFCTMEMLGKLVRENLDLQNAISKKYVERLDIHAEDIRELQQETNANRVAYGYIKEDLEKEVGQFWKLGIGGILISTLICVIAIYFFR